MPISTEIPEQLYAPCDHGHPRNICLICSGFKTPQVIEEKFCINCKHIATNSSRDWERYKCMAPQNLEGKNPVTGENSYRLQFCTNARLSARIIYPPSVIACGPEGKWFEPAPEKIEVTTSQGTCLVTNDFGVTDLDKLRTGAAQRVAQLLKKGKLEL